MPLVSLADPRAFWMGVALVTWLPLSIVAACAVLHVSLRVRYLHNLTRIFTEKPLFIVPSGPVIEDAEPVVLRTTEGLALQAIYLKHTAAGPRRGVILFGLEFGSRRWACGAYCDHLRDAGYDIFTYEPRSQGDSDKEPGYESLQWVTDKEVADCRTALAYLKKRPDADPRGVGLFGISKGGGAGLVVAADDRTIRCVVTDGAFAAYSTTVPYMMVWFTIYNPNSPFHGLFPYWYYGSICLIALHQLERERGTHFPHIENAVRRLAPRPLLMIQGEQDTYIKPSMTRRVFSFARPPKELWIVPDAKHNQALHLAGNEYRARVRQFFDAHLATVP